MDIVNNRKKHRSINDFLEKIKSSIKNKYCLFCRSEIIEDHYCEQLEILEDKLVEIFFEIKSEDNFYYEDHWSKETKSIKKEIMDYLEDPLIKNEQVIENIKNKILAYSL